VAVDSCGVTYVAGGTPGDLAGGSSEPTTERQAYVLPVEWE
jgi:hypothetical protein